MKKGQAVIVTTEHRGVFFGYLHRNHEEIPNNVKLKNCRNALYWDQETKGFIGLAANGPTKGCRIGPAAPTMELKKITSIAECTEQAVKAWESAPWK